MADGGTALAVLTVAAGLALLVERIIEALKHLIDGAVTADAEKARLQQVRKANETAAARLAQTRDRILSPPLASNAETDERAAGGEENSGDAAPDELDGIDESTFERSRAIGLRKLAAPEEADFDLAHRRLFYLTAALGLGIGVTAFMPLGMLGALFVGDWAVAGSWHAFADRILTGIVIAGGTQPIHLLLRFLATRSAPAEALAPAVPAGAGAERAELAASGLAPASEPTAAARAGWIRIDYRGGVSPEKLETRNLRSGDPEQIIYHHTAMASGTGFQAVVDEFLINKGWSTGYHCVVMPDGAAQPFCRWDRRGNHTRTLNDRSLGLAFHGNFHSDPSDRYSNHDGRYGNREPTRQQLDAGARVIALWALLYAIPANFGASILAHRDARPGHTVCPGSDFPQSELEQLIVAYVERWQNEPAIEAELLAFRHQPFLFVRHPMTTAA